MKIGDLVKLHQSYVSLFEIVEFNLYVNMGSMLIVDFEFTGKETTAFCLAFLENQFQIKTFNILMLDYI